MEKYYGYYKSTIGILEIITSKDALISVMFVESMQNDGIKNDILDRTVNQIDEYFAGKRKDFDLNLYFEGTEYQKIVWKELLKIPYGETITYKELAIRIGDVRATRAVGNANGKNKLSIIVPCHRVIGTNGKLTGYAGGLDKKQWLLEHERNSKY
jgi:methylated-DNA-[protein]-cysteine S-methyltransferase